MTKFTRMTTQEEHVNLSNTKFCTLALMKFVAVRVVWDGSSARYRDNLAMFGVEIAF